MDYNCEVHTLRCPKCRQGMEPIEHDGITIDRCSGCQGLWFDGDEAQQLKASQDSEKLDSGDPKTGRYYDNRGEIRCPHCGNPMEKSADWKQTHIWYETCREHGIFMDAGEFTDFKYDTLLDTLRNLLKGERPS
jgi:Zn-finger nucleic acid-binding protein